MLRRAVGAQDAEESWTDEERRALLAHIEEGYEQAERNQLIEGAQARREIQAMKENWHQEPLPAMSPYAVTPLANDDVFNLSSYISEDREDTADAP